jgi:hypothetical protein
LLATSVGLGVTLVVSACARGWFRARVSSTLDALRTDWKEHPLGFLFFAVSLGAGIALRLSFPGDIEYKGDEAWMFQVTREILQGGPWPGVGMASSTGIDNPGLSVWVFPALAWLTGADDPVSLASAVELLNCFALGVLFFFAWQRAEEDRGLWLWTAALAAVDPLGIVLQRKIWAQSVLPIFALALFLTWRARARALPAFLWGIAGAVIGQVHMSGFFYAFVFVLWAAWASLRWYRRQPTRWFFWLVGSVLGSLPMIPWIQYLLKSKPSMAHWGLPPPALGGNVWRLWIEDATGWNLEYSIGRAHLKQLEAWPLIGGTKTHLVSGALLASAILGGLLVLFTLWGLVRERAAVVERVSRDGPVAHNLGFGAYGLLMNVLPFSFYRHYLILAYPFESMTLPLLGWLPKRRMAWLAVLWLSHLIIAVSLLYYLHATHGAPGADYGVAYQFQGRH